VPDDLGRRAVEARRAAEYLHAEHQAFQDARADLRGRLDTALLAGVDHGLRALSSLLAELLDEARDLAPIVADLDADHAIDRGYGDQWRRFGRLADRLGEIREAQARIMCANGRRPMVGTLPAVALMSIAGHVRRFGTLWPEWRAVGTDGAPPPPWPYDRLDDHLPPAATRAGLAWLVAHPEADPWIPTTEEALDAFYAAQQVGADRDAASLATTRGGVCVLLEVGAGGPPTRFEPKQVRRLSTALLDAATVVEGAR